MRKEVKRGDIYYARLDPVVGSEQGGVRPVLIISNDIGNRFSPTVIVAAITSKKVGRIFPTHVCFNHIRGLRVRLLANPWTAAYQAPPSLGFSRQKYWSGVPLPSPVLMEGAPQSLLGPLLILVPADAGEL